MGTPGDAGEPLTPAVFHVLVALADGPLHGYGVMKRVEEDSGQAMGPGTIYGSIQRLEDAGWVREDDADPTDARGRRSFALTAEGRSALAAELGRFRRLTRLARQRGVSDPAEAS